ncbi:unnamed protein product [Macrosiphum euphorbiae]|uniref:Uncharacterized protein n=1 Tax=Macrosiphum euphorbiae TaxID=13131 RepID=A0AAV0WHL2_9HEMI|nr:unnamed protein product [Macrosiphum euphorbiae]
MHGGGHCVTLTTCTRGMVRSAAQTLCRPTVATPYYYVSPTRDVRAVRSTRVARSFRRRDRSTILLLSTSRHSPAVQTSPPVAYSLTRTNATATTADRRAIPTDDFHIPTCCRTAHRVISRFPSPKTNIGNRGRIIILLLFILGNEDPDMIVKTEYAARQRQLDMDNIPIVRIPLVLPSLENQHQLCIICTVEERTHTLIPCGHKIICVM